MDTSVIEPNTSLLQELQVLQNLHWIQKDFKGSGRIEFQGELHFFGQWEGEWHSPLENPSYLWIGEGAHMKGRIHCSNVLVQGELRDIDIICRELRVLKGARIFGKITSEVCIIEEGALVEADFQKLSERGRT